MTFQPSPAATESPRLRTLEAISLLLIVAVYLALGAAYAVRTPDWQAPDEPAHVNYVRQIADDGRLPVIRPGDWNNEYQETLKAQQFDPQLTRCTAVPAGMDCPGIEAIQYEDHQPPLYYLSAAPVYALSDGDLTALRLWSVLLGAGVVVCAWGVLRRVVPGWPVLALAGAGFVAFLPQHLSILGSVNNDALAELVAGLTLWATVAYLAAGSASRSARITHPAVLGGLVGVALITKTTVYFLAGIALLAVLLRARRARWPWSRTARDLAWVLLPALILGGAWWARNLSVYSGLDFLGLGEHDTVVVGQMRTADYIDTTLGGDRAQYVENALTTTFHSFWGQFGWMALPMPVRVYRGLLLLTLALLAGAAIYLWRERARLRWDALALFGAVILLVAAQFALYNRTFVQFQGRYLFPALIPLAALVALGLGGWTGLLPERVPLRRWLPLGAVAVWALFALYALETYIVPNLRAWE